MLGLNGSSPLELKNLTMYGGQCVLGPVDPVDNIRAKNSRDSCVNLFVCVIAFMMPAHTNIP
jgi:hypothetical protein